MIDRWKWWCSPARSVSVNHVAPVVIRVGSGPAQRIGFGQHVVVGVVGPARDAAEGVDLLDDIAAAIVFFGKSWIAELIRDSFQRVRRIVCQLHRVAGRINDPCQPALGVVLSAHSSPAQWIDDLLQVMRGTSSDTRTAWYCPCGR